MKFKRSVKMVILGLLVLSFSALAYAAKTAMPQNERKGFIGVFTPNSPYVVVISGAGNVNVSNYRVIKFQDQVTIYWGSDSSKSYIHPANVPIGILPGSPVIHVSAATKMLVM